MADPTKSTTLPPAKGPSARSSLSEEELRVRLNYARTGTKPASDGDREGNRLVEAIKTFLWVAPLTALIWIYAEREQIAVLNDVPVTLEARSPLPDRIVTIIRPDDRRAYVNLEGPRASLDRVRDRLADPSRPLELLVPEELQPGSEGEVSITERINNNDVFRGSAVKVSRARPAIRVRVEQKLSRRLPVRAGQGSKIVGDITFEPDVVTVDGPAAVFATLQTDQFFVSADLSRYAAKPPGEYEGEVPLRFPHGGENVTLPKNVKVKLVIKESVVVPLHSIPIVVQLPARVLQLDRYKVLPTLNTLPNVSVTGPPDAIDAIQKGRFSPAAILDLTLEDLQPPFGVEKSKRITAANYRMPKDVTVTNPDSEITFKVEDRGQ